MSFPFFNNVFVSPLILLDFYYLFLPQSTTYLHSDFLVFGKYIWVLLDFTNPVLLAHTYRACPQWCHSCLQTKDNYKKNSDEQEETSMQIPWPSGFRYVGSGMHLTPFNSIRLELILLQWFLFTCACLQQQMEPLLGLICISHGLVALTCPFHLHFLCTFWTLLCSHTWSPNILDYWHREAQSD